MKLTMLGTGNTNVTECYNTCFVLSGKGGHFLVDGGGGNAILRQLKAAGLDWKDIRDIFVTHKHMDHLIGVLWMIRMISQHMAKGEYEGDVRIYAHAELIGLIRDISGKLMKSGSEHIGGRIHLIAVEDGGALDIIGHKTTFFDMDSSKARQFGFSMDTGGGGMLTCCGDEPCKGRAKEYARDSKWLLHEAFCLYSERDIYRPYEISHSTVKDACELAEELHVKNLILYHTEDDNIRDRKRLYAEEGKKYFHGNLYIPDDLETIEL